jgi:hypothetical protein
MPAPIVEEEKPTLAPRRSEAKATAPKKTPAESSSLGKFEGTWTGSAPDNSAPTHHTGQFSNVLVIKNGSASLTTNATRSLLPGQVWTGASAGYETVSTTMARWRWSSNDLRVDGSNLRIKWPAGQLIDWSPKVVLSAEAVEKVKASDKPKTSVYTLSGNQLTREFDANGGVTYSRAK